MEEDRSNRPWKIWAHYENPRNSKKDNRKNRWTQKIGEWNQTERSSIVWVQERDFEILIQ